jgi:hypothetical protein
MVANRLDIFIVSKALSEATFRFHQWVPYGGDSDPNHIFLKIAPFVDRPPNPFKLNLAWLEGPSFINEIKDHQRPPDDSLLEFPPL